MRQYALTILNMMEYDGIHLEKQTAEYARILNVSDAVLLKLYFEWRV